MVQGNGAQAGHEAAAQHLPSIDSSRWSSYRSLRRRLGPILLNTVLTLSAAVASGVTLFDEAEARTSELEPRANSGLTTPVRSKLTRAFRIAIELIVASDSCGQLFAELKSDGVRALQYSIYVPVKRGLETRICEDGAVAYTEVGSSVTRLCPGFARLVDRRAAFTLVHEALHYAGMGEKPSDPDGLTTDQITRLVIRACR